MANTPTLEETLAKVESLRRDLNAEIVLEPEIGHSVKCYSHNITSGRVRGYESQYNNPDEDDGWEEWIIDKPAVTKPDEAKIEAARAGLQQFYDYSEWYSARYVAGRDLGLDEKALSNQLEKWLVDLNSELKLPTTEYQFGLSRRNVDSPEEEMSISIPIPENKKRFSKASIDIFELYKSVINLEQRHRIGKLIHLPEERILVDEMLWHTKLNNDEFKIVYNSSYSNKFQRTSAGQTLGYSSLRIWAHEHPAVTRTMTGLAAAGATSGLGYMLYQYLAR